MTALPFPCRRAPVVPVHHRPALHLPLHRHPPLHRHLMGIHCRLPHHCSRLYGTLTRNWILSRKLLRLLPRARSLAPNAILQSRPPPMTVLCN